ncbi:Zinc finger protein ZPR1 [Blattella germanica]|nr:Zinc finger protein ZPR1 [Blattella germanica]
MSLEGLTRLLLTKIPFYKEVVLMSFECEHCGFKNNEIQPGGKVDEKGISITLHVQAERDLNRQVVKSDYTSVKIVELDFEIPAQSQKGEITTIEGVIDRAISGLEQDQPLRKIQNPDIASQIEEFLGKLQNLKSLEKPFTMVLRQYNILENPRAPQNDIGIEITRFTRTTDQDHTLGIFTSHEVGIVPEDRETNTGLLRKVQEGDFKLEDLHSIPHFKEVVIMATNCDSCGHRSNEVKSGGGIEPKGIRIEIKVRDKEDFSRDVLKSETCSLEVPELELSVGPYALGGRFTTVEGILTAMKDQLTSEGSVFIDSADDELRQRMSKFTSDLSEILEGKREVTVVLDDPAGNSYVQSLTHPEPDPGIKILNYERTHEHNEELGLNDIKTENYEDDVANTR